MAVSPHRGDHQDKLKQKEAFVEAGLATAPFVRCDEPSVDTLLAFGAPLVQKARRGGYDGKGVAVFTDIIREEAILPVSLPAGGPRRFLPRARGHGGPHSGRGEGVLPRGGNGL